MADRGMQLSASAQNLGWMETSSAVCGVSEWQTY